MQTSRLSFIFLMAGASALLAQSAPDHNRHVHGVPGGMPALCAAPTVTAVADGAWSDPVVWSTKRPPSTNDRVEIGAGRQVMYDAVRDAKISCIDVRGRLTFKSDANTRLRVGNLMVWDEGTLEVGTEAHPISPNVTAEIVITDQPVDRKVDPAEIGNGIEALGKISMHGAVKLPTFLRLSSEPLAGQTTLTLERSAAAWKQGNRIVIPDTRQLRDSERGSNYKSQDEKLEIASVSGNEIKLSSALKYNHPGARNGEGKLEFLPHVGNLSRNVIVRSENPTGTRGHMIFMSRANVDLRFVEVREMGRTRMGVLDNTEFNDSDQVVKLGTNQIGRYGIHFHHYFGPKETPGNGYQFTLIGNSVDGAPKWGITVHNSHYGLIQDNVVYNTRGAGIVTEDGTESFNLFDHNFALRSEGSGEFAPSSGYSGAGPDPGGEGSGFWFRGPNNYIRNNVASNADVFGFGLAAGLLGAVQVPKFKGADTSVPAETVSLDTTEAPVLEFANNEAYGAIQTGVACGWNGTITNFRVWHPSRHGVTGTPTDKLVVDKITVLGDKAILADEFENPTGMWITNYLAKSIVVKNADIQGMRTGISSPFFRGDQKPEPGRGDGSVTIENSFFQDYVGIVVATAYTPKIKNEGLLKTATVRDSVFQPLAGVPTFDTSPPAAISMNYRMASSDPVPRDPIAVYNFNQKAGDNFKVFYSLDSSSKLAPCNESRPGIGGWVCK